MKRNVRAVVISTAALTVIGGGGALAYWTNTSKSLGSASVGSTALVASVPVTSDVLLRPGGSQQYYFTVSNTGSSPATVTSLTFKIANEDGSAWAIPGCSAAADFAVGPVTDGAGGTFAPREFSANSVTSFSATITMINRAADQNACKNVTLPLQVDVS